MAFKFGMKSAKLAVEFMAVPLLIVAVAIFFSECGVKCCQDKMPSVAVVMSLAVIWQ